MSINFEEDAARVPTNDELAQLSSLVAKQLKLEMEVIEKQSQLSKLELNLRQVSEFDIPLLMASLNLIELRMVDGYKVKVKPDIAVNIKDERKQLAFTWLKEHEYDDIIKTKVMCRFGKGQQERVKQLQQLMLTGGFTDIIVDESVHPQTLKSFCKELLEKGEDFPKDVFGVHEYNKTLITKQ